MVACTLVVAGGAAGHDQQASCSAMSRQSIFLLEAQTVPSATLIRLTRACDLAGATEIPLRSPPAGLRGYERPAARQPRASVRYFVFTGGCVTERFSFTRQSAPALYDQADQFLGFTPRSVYVHGVRDDEGLTLCGAEAPPCPG
jgi:hypothetical protein